MNKFKSIVFLLFVLAVSGCENSDTGLYFMFKNNTDILVKRYAVYEKSDGIVYIHIEKESDYSKIVNKPIQSVYIKKIDTLIQGKAIMSAFSREIDLTPFIFVVNNYTGYLNFEELNNKKVFFIGLKEDLLPLYEKGVIAPKSWDIEYPNRRTKPNSFPARPPDNG